MPSISFDHEEFVVDYQMNLIQRYLDHLEPLFEEEFLQWDNAVEERAQNISDETNRQEFYDYMSEDYIDRVAFRYILLNSFFAASFATFEHRLYQLCYRAMKYLQPSSSVKDLRKELRKVSQIDKAVKYLKDLGILFPTETDLWKNMERYRELRNRIMHEGGRIRPGEELRPYAEKHGIISPDDPFLEIRLTKDFCNQAVDSMRELLLEAIERYDRWLTEQS